MTVIDDTLPKLPPRVVLITGCSSGIGKALCYALHRKVDTRGSKLFRVVATARRGEDLHALEEDGVDTAACDVRDPGSISACVAHVDATAGAVHVLINNAGMQAIGPIAEQPLVQFEQVLDTNCTGAVRMMQAITPGMFKQGAGLIVNICSVSSYVDLPLSAAYCASKAALLSATNVARMELAPLGVRVMAVTAGVVESDIGSKALCDMERYSSPASAYYRVREAIRRRMAVPTELVGRVMRAEAAADAIVAAMLAKRPPRELVIGAKARSALLWGFLQAWVCPGVVERQFCRVFGLTELGSS